MAGPGLRRAAEAGKRAILTLAEPRQPTVGAMTGGFAVMAGGLPAVGEPDLLALMSRGAVAEGAVYGDTDWDPARDGYYLSLASGGML